MNNGANGNSSGCAGRNPAARQMRKTMLLWISRRAAERPQKHDIEPRRRRHQGFLQKPELAVPDNFDAAEDDREQDAHRDDPARPISIGNGTWAAEASGDAVQKDARRSCGFAAASQTKDE